MKENVSHTKENLETSEREAGAKAKEAAHESEQQQKIEAAERRNKEMRQLISKMNEEKRIYESEPENSVTGATAKGTYEADGPNSNNSKSNRRTAPRSARASAPPMELA